MSATSRTNHLLRREFLKAGGALIIGFSFVERVMGQAADATITSGPDQPDLNSLDTWIAVHADNTATIFFGFAELGQGNSTAILQMAADELDLDLGQVNAVRLDTTYSPNQGGTVASASIARGGPRIRAAAAQARMTLLGLASQRLNTPVEQLKISKGVVSTAALPQRSVTYGDLIGGKRFDVPFTGAAPLKSASEYKVIGTRVPRNDMPAKVSGKYLYMQHVRMEGMLHGRVVRPRGQGAYGAGATVLEIDEKSIRDIAGAQMIRKGNFVGVVAPNEWDAVRAAQALKVNWDTTPSLEGSAGLREQMRAVKTTDDIVLERGDVESALSRAAHVVSRTSFGPYQSHAVFAPNCALANVTANSALVMCSTQNIYETRKNLSQLLGMPAKAVRVQYYESSGTYGHSCYEDVAQSAAVMSQAAGKPVRLQFMRWDEFGWDNYGPAHLADIKAGVDSDGRIIAYQYFGSQHTWIITETAQQLALGMPAKESDGPVAQRLTPLNLGSMYEVANVRLLNRRVPGMNGYLKGSYLRSPLDIAVCFTSEQAIDELAYLAGMDPFLFRQKNIRDPRWLGVLNAVANASVWKPKRSGQDQIAKTNVRKGRGIAVGTHLSSYAAAVAEIEVHRDTGRIVAKHMYGAIDAGLTINPAFVENQISGMLIQATSRVLKEQVTFDKNHVTSLDWNSYPVLRFEESPEVTPIVVQRPEEKSSGAGEEALGPAAAAIANAFFDATSTRLHEFPMTPARVLTALRDS